MRVKRVNRYYCDFCKKAGCSAYYLRSHEEHCTLNPNRVCRMCGLLDQQQPSLQDLIALLPNPDDFKKPQTDDELWDGILYGMEAAMVPVLPVLRERAGNCPACILSALRQAKIPVPLVEGFEYGAESKALRTEYYDAQNADKYDYV